MKTYLHRFAVAKPDSPHQCVKLGAELKSMISYLCDAFQHLNPLWSVSEMHGEAEMDM